MRIPKQHARWPIAAALFVASCSQSPTPTVTSPSDAPRLGALGDGRVSASAEGDVKVGSGILDLERLRMDRQSSPGVSVLRQYANPGGTYAIKPGETIELWAEYTPGVTNPRFRVDWGDGSEVDITGCGSCKLTHIYRDQGTFTVRATVDDRVSTTVTRTFRLDSRSATAAAPVLLQTVCGFPAPQVFAGGNCSFNTAAFANYWCQLGGYTGAVSYTEVTSGSFNSLYYNGGNVVLNSCAQVNMSGYGFGLSCTGVTNLMCAP